MTPRPNDTLVKSSKITPRMRAAAFMAMYDLYIFYINDTSSRFNESNDEGVRPRSLAEANKLAARLMDADPMIERIHVYESRAVHQHVLSAAERIKRRDALTERTAPYSSHPKPCLLGNDCPTHAGGIHTESGGHAGRVEPMIHPRGPRGSY